MLKAQNEKNHIKSLKQVNQHGVQVINYVQTMELEREVEPNIQTLHSESILISLQDDFLH